MGGVIEGDFRPIADRKALKRWGFHIVGKKRLACATSDSVGRVTAA